MRVEFAFRTYRSFGPDANGALAAQWVEKRLQETYGGPVKSVLVECCCPHPGKPRRTLESLHSRFEDWLGELPIWETSSGDAELRICYKSPRYEARDIEDGSQLSPDRFFVCIKKAAEVLEPIAADIRGSVGMDAESLAADLSRAAGDAPRTLDQIATLYLERRSLLR